MKKAEDNKYGELNLTVSAIISDVLLKKKNIDISDIYNGQKNCL